MIKKSLRLSRTECETVLRRGRRVHGRHFTLLYTDATVERGASKYAVVVSKKVARTAVARHKLRRAVYDMVLAVFVAHAGHVVVVAKKGAPALTVDEVRQELSDLAARMTHMP